MLSPIHKVIAQIFPKICGIIHDLSLEKIQARLSTFAFFVSHSVASQNCTTEKFKKWEVEKKSNIEIPILD